VPQPLPPFPLTPEGRVAGYRLAERAVLGSRQVREEAWEELLQRYDGVVEGVTRKALHSYHCAHLAQDCKANFIGLLFRKNKLAKFLGGRSPEQSNLGGWLSVCAGNYARRDFWRSQQKAWRAGPLRPEEADTASQCGESQEIRKEHRERLRERVRHLPQRQRICVTIKYYGKLDLLPEDVTWLSGQAAMSGKAAMSEAELNDLLRTLVSPSSRRLGDLMGMTAAAFNTNVHRARKQIKEWYGEKRA